MNVSYFYRVAKEKSLESLTLKQSVISEPIQSVPISTPPSIPITNQDEQMEQKQSDIVKKMPPVESTQSKVELDSPLQNQGNLIKSIYLEIFLNRCTRYRCQNAT